MDPYTFFNENESDTALDQIGKLYKQVSATSGLVRDQNPMTGYEALTTSTDGVIPKITSALSAGTYYLSEVTPPTGYQQLAGDLVFTVSEAGVVEIPSHVDSDDPASLVILNNLTDLNPAVTDWISSKKVSGHTTYTIRIPNELAGVPVRIVKVDQEGRPLEGATFTLAGDSLPEEVSCTSTKGIVTYGETTVEEALIYANETLLMGTYTLTETSSPDWYFAPEGPVTIEVENTATGIVVTAKINGEQTAFAKAEDRYFISGSGVDEPVGLLHATEGAENGASANQLSYDAVIDLYYSVKPEYRRNGVWLMNDETAQTLKKLKDDAGNYLWRGSDDTVMGKPVMITEYMPDAEAGARPILFGDLSYYWIVKRSPVTVRMLRELFVLNGQIGYMAFELIDGRLVRREAVKALNIASE